LVVSGVDDGQTRPKQAYRFIHVSRFPAMFRQMQQGHGVSFLGGLHGECLRDIGVPVLSCNFAKCTKDQVSGPGASPDVCDVAWRRAADGSPGSG
jgi:hypothetical protein